MSQQADRIEALLTRCVALLERQLGAADVDLDSEYGNFSIRKDPPKWVGRSFVGCRLSECTPDFLDAFASFCDWKAGKDESEGTPEKLKYAGYARKDAARARGWAKRLRSGKEPPQSTDDPF